MSAYNVQGTSLFLKKDMYFKFRKILEDILECLVPNHHFRTGKPIQTRFEMVDWTLKYSTVDIKRLDELLTANIAYKCKLYRFYSGDSAKYIYIFGLCPVNIPTFICCVRMGDSIKYTCYNCYCVMFAC